VSDYRTLLSSGISTPEGIAVDWLTKLVYFVDSTLDRIDTCTIDGKWRTTIVQGGMANLRALTLDPTVGMYKQC
jgi:hypothetical protein